MMIFSRVFLSFKVVMALFDLMFLYEIGDSETVFSISVKNCNEVFILIVLNLKMFLLEMSFHNTNLANPWMWRSFYLLIL